MAIGLEVAVELAPPVAPVLVADDWPTTAPEFPERAVGVISRSAFPPCPPVAAPLAMLSPPMTRVPLAPRRRARAEPPAPATGAAAPPAPPSPARPKASTVLSASPVAPEVAATEDDAPELAVLSTPPMALASPVRPESPEPPVVAAPRALVNSDGFGLAAARRAELSRSFAGTTAARRAAGEVEWPLLPVSPESPEVACGLAVAVDEAPPVAPVLVAED